MTCPSCGATNRSNAKFCASCRTPLPASVPSSKTRKGCPQCGTPNRVRAKFCTACGYTFQSGAQSPAAPPPGAPAPSSSPSNRKRLPLYLTLAVTVLTLVGAGLFLAGRIGRDSGAAATLDVATPTTELAIASTATAALIAAPTASLPLTAMTPSPAPPSVTEVAVATQTAAPSPTTTDPLPSATVPVSASALEQALKGTVQIIVPAGGSSASTGSGSVITEAGHILTNFHVIGDASTGRLYNASGVIFIAISPPELRGDPEIQFMAELAQADQAQDLALLRIVAGAAGEPLPPTLELSPIPIGNSDEVSIGDDLTVIGFPGLGGATLTLTRGSVAGFLSDEGEWIKTDAEINRGNSGGAAINEAGDLIGVPSAAATDTIELPGKIGLIRPVNLAAPLIELARQEASSEAVE